MSDKARSSSPPQAGVPLRRRERGRLSSQVREVLAERVASGQIRPGAKLPPEPELAVEFEVSRATLREALRSLEEDGFITRSPGAGTFVTHRPRLTNNLDVNRAVTEVILGAGGTPDTESVLVTRAPATDDQVQQLGLDPGGEVLLVERVRTANRRPVVFSEDALPASLIGDREAALLSLKSMSIYELLEREFGIPVHHAVARFWPMKADRRVADRLRVIRGALILALVQVDYDERGRPVLYSREFHLADAFEFAVVRKGPGPQLTRRRRTAGGVRKRT